MAEVHKGARQKESDLEGRDVRAPMVKQMINPILHSWILPTRSSMAPHYWQLFLRRNFTSTSS